MPVGLYESHLIGAPNLQSLFAMGYIGGSHVGGRDIYRFSCDDNINLCEWTKSDVQLKYGRRLSVAMVVPNTLVDKLCQQT